MSEVKSIAVCGLGKLGSCIATAFAAGRIPVIGTDTDEKKLKQISAWQAPVQEPDLQDYLDLQEVREHLRFTSQLEEVVRLSDACLFVTPTPSLSDGSFDHTFLLKAVTNIAREVKKQNRKKYLFIVNSTVVPGFLNSSIAPVLRGKLNGLGFGLVYKPEFIALGTVIRDLLYPDVLLIGEDSEEAGQKVERLYRELVLHDCQSRRMPLVDAELAKISLNCAVTMKISFANQVGQVARRLGADPKRVLGAVGLDRRVGHPALRPGLPFGGPCFPRDNRMFQYVAATVGERAPLAEATDVINKRLLRTVLDEIPERGEIGVLGLAYKPGAAIADESPGAWWTHVLRSRGRKVLTVDPVITKFEGVSCSKLEEVLRCKTILIGCPWPEYQHIEVPESSLVIDCSGEIKVSKYKVEKEKEALAQWA